jgi:hypothetical protein
VQCPEKNGAEAPVVRPGRISLRTAGSLEVFV